MRATRGVGPFRTVVPVGWRHSHGKSFLQANCEMTIGSAARFIASLSIARTHFPDG